MIFINKSTKFIIQVISFHLHYKRLKLFSHFVQDYLKWNRRFGMFIEHFRFVVSTDSWHHVYLFNWITHRWWAQFLNILVKLLENWKVNMTVSLNCTWHGCSLNISCSADEFITCCVNHSMVYFTFQWYHAQ